MSLLQHSIPRPQACSHQSETQQSHSLPPVRPGGNMPANPNSPTHPPILTPSQQALLCPIPWAVGLGYTTCVLGGGGTRESWFLSRKLGLISEPTRSVKITEGGLVTYGLISFTTTCTHRLSLDLISDKLVSDLFPTLYPMVRACRWLRLNLCLHA